MTEIKFNEHTLLLYSSVKEMPMHLYKKMNHYALRDAGIGSNLNDVDTHFMRAHKFTEQQDMPKLQKEFINLRYNLFAMLSELDFKSLTFATLIHSIDGVQVVDYSDDGLNRIIDELSIKGLTQGDVYEFTDEIKKKWIPNYVYTSPNGSRTIAST